MPEPQEPTQRTPRGKARKEVNLPGKGGTVIPVPSEDEVFDAFRKIAGRASPNGQPQSTD